MIDNLNVLDFDIPDNLLEDIANNIENLIKTFDVPEENKMEVIKQINYMYSRSKYLSLTDELTGLPNRRCFESVFEKEFLRATRYSNKLTFAICDIDFFKKVNDTYGHACGDMILKQVADAALQTFRKTDAIFRIGGEEFAVILTETDIQQSIIPLERFRKTIETLNPEYNDETIKISVSIGACQLDSTIQSREDFFKTADDALYKAKEEGRNRLFINNF